MNTHSWRMVVTQSEAAAYNMAVDEAIFNGCRRGTGRPTLRLYTWRPPAVSLGYGQTLEAELDPRRCRAYGIDIVRRPSGGRAVLHDEELTYALILPEGFGDTGRSAYEVYRWMSDLLISALRDMGVPAELAVNSGVDEPDENAERADGETDEDALSSNEREGACFTQSARYEIEVHGRKLVGSAQRRANGYILQHGSLLLGPGHKRLPLLLPHALHRRRERMALELDRHTVSLSELVGKRVRFEDMVPRIMRAFSKSQKIPHRLVDLTASERAEATILVEDKYGHSDWNNRRIAAYGQ